MEWRDAVRSKSGQTSKDRWELDVETRVSKDGKSSESTHTPFTQSVRETQSERRDIELKLMCWWIKANPPHPHYAAPKQLWDWIVAVCRYKRIRAKMHHLIIRASAISTSFLPFPSSVSKNVPFLRTSFSLQEETLRWWGKRKQRVGVRAGRSILCNLEECWMWKYKRERERDVKKGGYCRRVWRGE